MSCGTLVPARSLVFSLTRLLRSLAALSNALQLRLKIHYAGPQPRKACSPVWALPISLAATFGIDLSFFSSGYLDVSVPRVPSPYTMDSCMRDRSSTCRVSTFGYQGIYACLRLPLAFRSLPRPSSALGALASALCSYSLDFFQSFFLRRVSKFSGSIAFPVLFFNWSFKTSFSSSLNYAVVKVRRGLLPFQASFQNPENDTEERDFVILLADFSASRTFVRSFFPLRLSPQST